MVTIIYVTKIPLMCQQTQQTSYNTLEPAVAEYNYYAQELGPWALIGALLSLLPSQMYNN